MKIRQPLQLPVPNAAPATGMARHFQRTMACDNGANQTPIMSGAPFVSKTNVFATR
jgi:hypothetical protein